MTLSIMPGYPVFEFKVIGGFPQSAESGLRLHFNWLAAKEGVFSERRGLLVREMSKVSGFLKTSARYRGWRRITVMCWRYPWRERASIEADYAARDLSQS